MPLQSQFKETLTKVGIKYVQDPANFKASKIFPVCTVNMMAGVFPTWAKEYWMKNEAKPRKPGTESAGSPQGRGEDSYSVEDISFHEDVPEENIQNDPKPLNPLKSATRRATHKISLYDEVYFATNFFTSGVWTAGSNPSTKWNAANSTPLEDVDGYKRGGQTVTGMTMNKAVMSQKVFDVLKRHPDVKDQIKYTSAKNITPELLAAILELESLVIMNAVYDAAKYGATAAMQYVAGDSFLLLHTTNTPSLEEPSAGYNFVWNKMNTGAEDGYFVKTIMLEKEGATRVEPHWYHQFKVVAPDLGVFVAAPLS